MSDSSSRRAAEAPEGRSPFSEKLAAAPPLPGPESLPEEERAKLAGQKVGLTLKGWRLAKLLGVGPVSAAYDVTRGSRDGASRGVLRLMIGSIAKNERARSHFLRGAYAANRFQHPRVIAVTADGTDDDGAPFVVRPWADAEPLTDAIARDGPMKEATVLRFVEQLLDALEIAHAHGVVHGAISPANVLVTPRGSMRLVDFATPPGMGPTRSGEDALAARRATPWTATERCSSSPDAPSEVSDVWSVGACMFFALTGSTPRGEASSIADLARTAPRPLKGATPSVNDGLAAVVDCALKADPHDRYDSAYAMLGDVRRVMAGRSPKLGDAQKPNPSGSYSGSSPNRSARHTSAISNASALRATETSIMQPAFSAQRTEPAQRAGGWKGNVALILAIALLVGIATFVMVRERVEDERSHGHGWSPASQGNE